MPVIVPRRTSGQHCSACLGRVGNVASYAAREGNEGGGVVEPKNLKARIRADKMRFDPIAVGNVHRMTLIIELKLVRLNFLFF